MGGKALAGGEPTRKATVKWWGGEPLKRKHLPPVRDLGSNGSVLTKKSLKKNKTGKPRRGGERQTQKLRRKGRLLFQSVRGKKKGQEISQEPTKKGTD